MINKQIITIYYLNNVGSNNLNLVFDFIKILTELNFWNQKYQYLKFCNHWKDIDGRIRGDFFS